MDVVETLPRHSDTADVTCASSLVSTITDRAQFFAFSYSPPQRSLVSWTNNAEKVLGVKDIAIARDGNLFLRHVHPDDKFLLLTQLEEALEGRAQYRTTYRWIRPDNNETRWLHCRAGLNKDSESNLFEGVIIDLSSEFLGSIGKFAGPDSINNVLAAFPVVVFTLDRDLRLLRINRPSHARFPHFGDPSFKFENLRIGKPIVECFSDDANRAHFLSVMRRVLNGEISCYRTRLFEADEQVLSLEIMPLNNQDSIEGLLGISSDVSETVRLERQLAELQKAEGLKLLAAGIAHHFNNALQSIIGQASIINSHPERTDLVVQASQAIMEVVTRSADLSKQLYVFDDESAHPPVAVDINLAVMAAANRIENFFTSSFKVGVVFGNIPAVMARHAELVDAVEALLKNAKDATLENASTNAQTLSVKTYEVTIGELEVADLPAGRYIKLSVTDSGKGMPQEAQRRCFEPFYSTKDPDPQSRLSLSAMGLGLSKAFAVVRKYKGTITVESRKGSGSTFAIYLPVNVSAIPLNTTSITPSGTKPQILIVDDDSMVLDTVHSLLSDLGYTCLTAQDSDQALDRVSTHRGSLDLILLDMLMPKMDGISLMRKIHRLEPGLKVVGFSGASENEIQAMLRAGARRVLKKPVDPATLKRTISEILDTSSPAKKVETCS